MNPDKTARPIIRKTAARSYYLQIAAEWMTGKRRVPAMALADAEKAARAALARHACQPKAHIKLPGPDRGNTPSANSQPSQSTI